MAGNPECQYSDGKQAVFIGTNLNSGETVTLCEDDFLTFCEAAVEGFTGVPIHEVIAGIIVALAADAEAAAEAEADDLKGNAMSDADVEAIRDAIDESIGIPDDDNLDGPDDDDDDDDNDAPTDAN